jgi:hypothetical protein
MRTTIEIKPEHRAKLLELAARQGVRGFSALAGEALEAYFRAEADREALRRRAVCLKGGCPPVKRGACGRRRRRFDSPGDDDRLRVLADAKTPAPSVSSSASCWRPCRACCSTSRRLIL